MLKRLLTEIEQSDGPLVVDELARRLDLDPGVVTGMIRLLQAQRRLRPVAAPACPPGCAESCREGCPFFSMAPVFTVAGSRVD